jgi:hypothetical protein
MRQFSSGTELSSKALDQLATSPPPRDPDDLQKADEVSAEFKRFINPSRLARRRASHQERTALGDGEVELTTMESSHVLVSHLR